MATKEHVKFIEIQVWLGTNKRTIVRASKSASTTAVPPAADFVVSGIGMTSTAAEVLGEVLAKIGAAFPAATSRSIEISVEQSKIVPD